MTALPKLGINPKSEYDTPLGIYAYPLDDPSIIDRLESENPPDDRIEDEGTEGLHLPYRGWERYANIILAPLNSYRVLSEFTDYEHVYRLVKSYMIERSGIENFNTFFNNLEKAGLNNYYSKKFIDVSGAQAYFLTQQCAYYYALRKRFGTETAIRKSTDINFSHSIFQDIRAPIIWNGILRTLGFDAVRDYGSGFIHTNEPVQICFLNTKPMLHIERFTNKSTIYNQKNEISSSRQFMRYYNEGKFSPEASLYLLTAILNKDFGEFLPAAIKFGVRRELILPASDIKKIMADLTEKSPTSVVSFFRFRSDEKQLFKKYIDPEFYEKMR